MNLENAGIQLLATVIIPVVVVIGVRLYKALGVWKAKQKNEAGAIWIDTLTKIVEQVATAVVKETEQKRKETVKSGGVVANDVDKNNAVAKVIDSVSSLMSLESKTDIKTLATAFVEKAVSELKK